MYYFEVFLISGDFSVGFAMNIGSGGSRGIHVSDGLGTEHESIGLHVNGDLWMGGIQFANWTQPSQTGDTIGCGIVLESNASRYFFTRNGKEIQSPGSSANLLLHSSQTPLVPCVGVPSAVDTVVRTNFGFKREHRFVWRGGEKVRIICQLGTGSASPMIDDSIRSGEAFLPPDFIRGHTISGDRRDVPPHNAEYPETEQNGTSSGTSRTMGISSKKISPNEENINLWQYSLLPRRQMRRHSDLLPVQGSRTEEVSDLCELAGSAAEVASLAAETDLDGHIMNGDVEKPQDLKGPQSIDLNDIKELARELRNATSAEDPQNVGVLSQLVDLCRSNTQQLNETVQQAIMGVDCGYELGELLTVHEMVTDATQAAEKKKTEMENGISAWARHDIFSMLCHLRGQRQKRYDAVWGLLR